MIIKPDLYLWRNRPGQTPIYDSSPERLVSAWESARERFAHELRSGRYIRVIVMMGNHASGKTHWLASGNKTDGSLCFDACHSSERERKLTLSAALREHPGNPPIDLVWIDTPVEVCLERNRLRDESRRVPEEVIRRIGHSIKLEPSDPVREGFVWKVLRVRA